MEMPSPLVKRFVYEVVYKGQLSLTYGTFSSEYGDMHRNFWLKEQYSRRRRGVASEHSTRTMLEDFYEIYEYWNIIMDYVNDTDTTLLMALMEDADGPFESGWPLVYLVIGQSEIRIIFSDTREPPEEVELDEIWNGPLNRQILETLVGRLAAVGYDTPDNPMDMGIQYFMDIPMKDIKKIFDSSFLAYIVPLSGDLASYSYPTSLLNWTHTKDLITVLQHTS